MTFKEFLLEGKRTVERAHQLLTRVTGMKKFKAVPYKNGRGTGASIKPANHDPSQNEVGSPYMRSMNLAVKKKRYEPELQRLAIKDIITPQRAVKVDGIRHKLDGTSPPPMPGLRADHGPPEVYYDHETNKHILWNGNHRLYAARLKGETHIDVHVYHKDSKKKPK